MPEPVTFCGTPDLVMGPACKWPHRAITYRLDFALPGLSSTQLRDGFREAIDPWQQEANITLEERTSGSVNLVVIDVKMDGHNGVLADCQLPCGLPATFQLQMRFDNSDTWPFDKYVKTARHEFGHGLGIGHLGAGNIMAPSLDMKVARLGSGDIGEIVDRYGRRVGPVPTPPPPGPVPPPVPPDAPSDKPKGLPDVFPGMILIRGVRHRLKRHGIPGSIVGKSWGPWDLVTILDDDRRPWKYFVSPEKPT